MEFHSPTYGNLTFDGVVARLLDYLTADPDANYTLMVGTDSQNARATTTFVSVVMVHRVGKGAIYFWTRHAEPRYRAMKPRILTEASVSLGLASDLAAALAAAGREEMPEVHIDVGLQGKTREMVREVVGMVTGSGFVARIKPESAAASWVADKFSKSGDRRGGNAARRREARWGKEAS